MVCFLSSVNWKSTNKLVDLLFCSLFLIGLVGADEAATVAATAEWGLCVPISWWWRSSSFSTAAATTTPVHVSTYGTPPPTPGLDGI